MIPPKHFYMIRHGETEANAALILAGSMDSPLTHTGRTQAKNIHHALPHLKIKPEIIIHSHLSRARDTATIINEQLNLPMIEDARYAEMHAGDWEGVSYEQSRPMLEGWVDAPNGETAQGFIDRVKAAKKTALSHEKSPPLIVCHGGVFRAFLQPYNIHSSGVKNCTLYEFTPKSNTAERFPWDVWRYDIKDNAQNNEKMVERTTVDLYKNPASEIA